MIYRISLKNVAIKERLKYAKYKEMGKMQTAAERCMLESCD